jgi:aspartyl protease family protein
LDRVRAALAGAVADRAAAINDRGYSDAATRMQSARIDSPDFCVSPSCFEGRRSDSVAPVGAAMFGRVIVLAAVAVALALLGSSLLLDRLPGPAPASAARAADSVAAEAPAPQAQPPQRQASDYREAMLEADQRGQYAADVSINGFPARMVIDTGATEVCVSASTARRLGLTPSGGRKRLIQTANGQSTADPTILRSLSLDGLYMNDVEALILAPEAGDVNLLGESFLKRLVSVEQRNATLVLRQ